MNIVFGIVSSFVPLLLIALVIIAVVVTRRGGEEDPEQEPGIGTARRVFLYALASLSLIFAAVGLSLLITGVADAAFADRVLSSTSGQIAVALAFTVVGAPAWLIFAWLAQRSVAEHPVERRSVARRLHINFARALSLVIVVVSLIFAARMLLAVDEFDGDPWGWAIVWSAIWLLYTALARREPPPSAGTRQLDRLYLYFAAVTGLYILGVGSIMGLREALSTAYDATFDTAIVGTGRTEGLRTAIPVVVVGGGVWAWHWLLDARRRPASTLWRVYVFLFGILAGLVVTVGAAANLLYDTLQWFAGVPRDDTAVAHFDEAPGAIALLVAGAAAWAYHRAVLTEVDDGAPARRGTERVYRYLVTAGGMVMLSAGLVTLLALAMDVLTPEEIALVRDSDRWRNPLVLGVTLIAVGAPLWARYWIGVQRAASAGGPEERRAQARRVFLFAIFGVAAVVALINLVIVLFQLFDATLEGDLGGSTLRDMRWSIALLLSAGAVAAYHWLVLREDRAIVGPDEPAAPAARPKSVMLLAGGPTDAIASALEAEGTIRVRTGRRLDAPDAATLAASEIVALRERIEASEADQLIVIVALDGGVEVVPYAPGD